MQFSLQSLIIKAELHTLAASLKMRRDEGMVV